MVLPPGAKSLARRPLVLLALSLGGGLLGRLVLGPLFLLGLSPLAGALLLVRPRGGLPWILLAGVFTGALLQGPPSSRTFPGGEVPAGRSGPKEKAPPPREDPARIFAASGLVASAPREGPSGDLTFLVHSRRGLLRVRWRRPTLHLGRGDQVHMEGLLRPGPTLPGGGPSLETCLTCGSNLVLRKRAPWWNLESLLDRARQALRGRLASTLPPQSRGVALCLVLGDPSYLDPWEELLFRRTGTAHLLVVSGLHVALVAWLAARLFRKGGNWIPFLAVTAYAFLSGARPPALRAALGFGIWALGKASGRGADLAGALAGAALPLLFFSPDRALGPSFQVSYAAVAAMALMGPALAGILEGLGLLPGPALALGFSTAATLGAGPLSLFYFGAFSPWSLLLTPLLTPLLGLEVFLSAGAVFLPLPASPPLALLHGLILGLLSFVDRTLPWTPLFTPWFPPAWLLAGTLLLVLLSLLFLPSRGRIPAWCLLFLPFFLPLHSGGNQPARGRLLDVGHGQCLVLDLPGLGVVVHDAGSLQAPRRTARDLLTLLQGWGEKRVDLLVVSHGDRDHVSALPWILSALPVGRILLPEHPKSRKLARLLARMGILPCFLPQGRTLERSFPGGRLLLLTPGKKGGTSNEAALVLYCRCRSFSLLSPGDLAGPGLARLCALGAALSAGILVAPHHGAFTGRERSLVRAFRTRYVLASRSRAQGPPPSAPSYKNAGARLYWTGRDGPLPLPLEPWLRAGPGGAPSPRKGRGLTPSSPSLPGPGSP